VQCPFSLGYPGGLRNPARVASKQAMGVACESDG
jgi:hypothetical protein